MKKVKTGYRSGRWYHSNRHVFSTCSGLTAHRFKHSGTALHTYWQEERRMGEIQNASLSVGIIFIFLQKMRWFLLMKLDLISMTCLCFWEGEGNILIFDGTGRIEYWNTMLTINIPWKKIIKFGLEKEIVSQYSSIK